MSAAAFGPLAITAASVVSAAGDDVEQTCASIRAGISALERHAYHEPLRRDPAGDEPEPLVAAAVRGVDPLLDGPDRLHALLAPVLRDLVTRGRLDRRDVANSALLLALPELDAATEGWRLAESFAPELGRRTGLAFKRTAVRLSGRAGVLELLGEASALIASGEARSCVVAGVDSYLSRDRLEHLDQGYRLRSRRGVDGFFPGEAAAAILVESPRRRREHAAAGVVATLGLGREPQTLASPRQSSGAGLTEALRAVLPAEGRGAPWVLCDLNGESYRAFEWGLTVARLGDRLGPVRRLVHPAMSLGDVGAATGGVLVAAALAAFERGYAPTDEAVLWASSDGPLRVAARLARA